MKRSNGIPRPITLAPIDNVFSRCNPRVDVCNVGARCLLGVEDMSERSNESDSAFLLGFVVCFL